MNCCRRAGKGMNALGTQGEGLHTPSQTFSPGTHQVFSGKTGGGEEELGEIVRKPSLWHQLEEEKSSLHQNPPDSFCLAPLKNKILNPRGKDNKIVIRESWWQLLPS